MASSRGAELGSMLREKWLKARKERKFWYIISATIMMLIMMANRTAATAFMTAARLVMTAAYLYRAISYQDYRFQS